jgi:hypothetical protein
VKKFPEIVLLACLLLSFLAFPALASAQANGEPVILTAPPTPAAPLTSDFSYPQTIKIGAVGAPAGTPGVVGIEWLVVFGLLIFAGGILLFRYRRRIGKIGH